LNVHPDWVVLQVDVANAFSSISCEAIFQELHVVGGQLFLFFHFFHYFYAHQLPSFFGHHSFKGKLFVILSSMDDALPSHKVKLRKVELGSTLPASNSRKG
jgi:hypothetical protein